MKKKKTAANIPPAARRSPGPATPGEAAVLAGLAGSFLFFALIEWGSPGRIWDGLRNAMQAIHLADAWRDHRFAILLKGYPLYHGNLVAYMMFPFFAWLGPSWTFVRLWSVGSALATLALTYVFARNAFGRRAATLAVLLLVIHPSFVLGARNFMDGIPTAGVFVMGTLLCLERWWTTRGRAWLAGAALLLGLGTGTFLWFLWFAAALAGAALVFAKDVSRRFGAGRSPRPAKHALAAAFALLAGLTPVLVGERFGPQPESSIERLVKRFGVETEAAGEPRPRSAAGEAVHHLDMLLSSGQSLRLYFKEKFRNRLYLPALALAFGWALFLAVRRGRGWRRTLFLGLLLLLMIAAMALSPQTGLATKMFFFYPFPQLFIAVCAAGAWERFRRGPARWAALILVAALAARDAQGMARTVRALRDVGGTGYFSDTIYDLASWLKSSPRGDETVLFLDHFTPENLRLLMPDHRFKFVNAAYVHPKWQVLPTKTLLEMLERDLEIGAARGLYVVRDCWDPDSKRPVWKVWEDGRFARVREFADRDGTPVLEVYSLRRSRTED
jgi:hypothetical protein